MKRSNPRAILIFAAAMGALLACPDVQAGCGCDHPTPCPAPVLPGFASPGDRIQLTGEGFSTAPEGNRVIFGNGSMRMTSEAAARTPEQLFVNVPERSFSMYAVGPTAIQVNVGKSKVAQYGEDSFTSLCPPLRLEEGQGHYLFSGYRLAVDSFGVLYIPLDVSGITEATNFMVYVDGLPLEFSTDDLLIYNKDGFNLNLFTLDVEGYEKQWGDWYGAQGLDNEDPTQSDVVTYWRHDFHAYAEAHAPGGTHYAHTENEDGYLVHPDGTIHVDHGRLVVAVAGRLRNPRYPDDEARMKPLSPGAVQNVTVHVLQLQTEDPEVWTHLTPEQEKILAGSLKVGTPYYRGFQRVTGGTGWDFDLPDLRSLIRWMD